MNNLDNQKRMLQECVLTLSDIAGNLSHNESTLFRQDAAKFDMIIALVRETALWKLEPSQEVGE